MTTTTPIARFAKATLNIGGMTCSFCANDIQHGLESLKTIKSCNISVLTHSGTVIFDQTSPASIQEIIELIRDKGYDCTLRDVEQWHGKETKSVTTADKQTRTVQLLIEGMFCHDCPAKITSRLSEHFGEEIEITQPLVLHKPMLSITYQPESPRISIRSIVAFVNSIDPSFTVRPYHPLSTEDESRSLQHQEQKAVFWRLCLAAIIAIPTLLIGVVWMSLVPEDNTIRQWFEQSIWTGDTTRAEWALLFLATPVYFVSASKFHVKAGREIYYLWRKQSSVPLLRRFYRFGSMSLLISAGTTVAYIASLISLILSATSRGGHKSTTYFDSVVFLTFFILIGRYLEAISKSKAGDAVSMLGQLKPETALLVMSAFKKASNDGLSGSSNNTEQTPAEIKEISADLLEIGDMVIVPRGSTPPADGVLVYAQGQFDESSLTGESRIVTKTSGDSMFLGTINAGDSVKMTITAIGGTSMLDQIIAVVREGQSKRAPVEHIADSITGYFVPVITVLAILTFFIWLALGLSGILDPAYVDNSSGGWAFWSLEFAIAVFVVACPCGIGLAAPTALYVGSGLAAKAGILVRGGGEAFQGASHLDAVVFDKTGTLTEGGDLKVNNCQMVDHNLDVEESLLWSMVRNLEENSNHPIAKAIGKASTEHQTIPIGVSEITEIPGQGMKGVFEIPAPARSRKYEAILGSELLINSHNPAALTSNTFIQQILSKWKTDCKSIAILAIRNNNTSNSWQIACLFALSDPVRPSSAPTIASLQAKGIKTYMLSGDNPETARAVALAVGIPVANVFASALPQDKAAKIEQLKIDLACPSQGSWFRRRSRKQSQARIAFVGDGINDAPALLASTVSISLSSGSPIALTSSSFILLTPSLESIITLLSLSKKVFRRIKWNFGWALVYNIVLVPVAAGVLFRAKEGGFILGPVWASAAMALSSLSVVMASLAMRWGW